MEKTGKIALITGVTGQDGAWLAEFLLRRGYEVHGIKRRSSIFNTGRIDHLYQDPHLPDSRFFLHYGDMSDGLGLVGVLEKICPDEIYHLAAQSHVQVSFEAPCLTGDIDAMGTMRLLEAIRVLGMTEKIRLYHAATSEMFGPDAPSPQNEETPFRPASPYAIAKLYGTWMVRHYRSAYGLFGCNGILFNHESPLRGETFVTRKITRAVAAVAQGSSDILYLGNLSARRDWGHARDYVRGMWAMLQQDAPDDYVLATGQSHSVRDFVERAFACIGRQIVWHGEGVAETGKDAQTGQRLVAVDARYFRPHEVQALCGDASKARRVLGWHPETGFDALVAEMVAADIERLAYGRG